uniref:Serpentine receptor class gamma n=1 Tax=Caenorhabditis tropicalis TaxID=1561998 RepID=A0A1I7TQR8_9PELO
MRTFQLKCQTTTQSSLILNKTPAGIQFIESILQIILPLFIFAIYVAIIVKILYMKKTTLNKNELGILKQAVFIFIAFQAGSLVFLSAQTFEISNVTAFLVKRFVNTMEIIAGAATPSFFFFTSKEIRKLISTRVSAASSQGGSNVQVRGIRTLD